MIGCFADLINDALKTLIGFDELVALLHNALVDEPPLLSRDGGFVATGYDAELDETRQLRDEGRSIIAKMQQEYIELQRFRRSRSSITTFWAISSKRPQRMRTK